MLSDISGDKTYVYILCDYIFDRMFEAGVRNGDTLCVINPNKVQDNFIGSRLTVLRSMHAKGITRVDMSSIEENKGVESFEELKYKSPEKND